MSAGATVARCLRKLTMTPLRRIDVEVGEPPTIKTCDQLAVPVDKQGEGYCYSHLGGIRGAEHRTMGNSNAVLCYSHHVQLEPRSMGNVVLSYVWPSKVSQETGRPGIDMGQPPAAPPAEPESSPPFIKYFVWN